MLSSSTNPTATESVSDHLQPEDIIDLTVLYDELPRELINIIQQYISVQDRYIVDLQRNIVVTNNAQIPIITLVLPSDHHIAYIDNIELYTNSHDQGWANPNTASYSWFDIELISIQPNIIQDNTATDTLLITYTRERCISNITANRNFHHYTKLYNNTSNLVQTYNNDLSQQLILYACCQYPGWANYIQQASIKIEYIRSYNTTHLTHSHTISDDNNSNNVPVQPHVLPGVRIHFHPTLTQYNNTTLS